MIYRQLQTVQTVRRAESPPAGRRADSQLSVGSPTVCPKSGENSEAYRQYRQCRQLPPDEPLAGAHHVGPMPAGSVSVLLMGDGMDQQNNNLSSSSERKVWVVVACRQAQEVRARVELERQGFDVYLPMRLASIRRQGRYANGARDLVARPFLPGYLFVRTSLALGDWRRIWSTFGVKGLLGSEERPTAVRDWVVDRIREQEEGGFIKLGLVADAPAFARGARVQLNGLDMVEGLFLEQIDERRASILVSLLGRDSRVTVDLAKLRSAGPK
jgi:transcriptional antiterminator RfaH